MSETDATNTQEKNTPPKFITWVEFILPSTGEKMVIEKLKSGSYYAAQKFYVEWMEGLQRVLAEAQMGSEEFVDAEGNPDLKRIEKALSTNKRRTSEMVLQYAEKSAQAKSKLIAICIGKTVEQVDSEYYPEDLHVIFEHCNSLNNFPDNIKKSVAPTIGIGA